MIKAFARSGSFITTHVNVAKLAKFSEFTPPQLNSIVSVAINNSQIRSIINDDDVREFLTKILKGNEALIDKDNWDLLDFLIDKPLPSASDDGEIPF